MSNTFISALLLTATICASGQAKGLERPAWRIPAYEVTDSTPCADFASARWRSNGWRENRVELATNKLGVAGQSLEIEATADPSGPAWAYFDGQLPGLRDWSAYQGIRFKIRAYCSDATSPVTLRLILNEERQMKLTFPPMRTGDERTVTVPFPADKRAALASVSTLRFFLVGRDYREGTKIKLRLWNFELLNMKEGLWELPPKEAGVELLIGDLDKVSLVKHGAELPKCKAVVYTGNDCPLQPEDVLVCTATELFTDKKTTFERILDREVPANSKSEFVLKLPQVDPGYYWVTCDLKREGKSLVDGRVGFADFYQRAENESLTHAMLSLRTGMGLYIIDPAGGFGSGSNVMMHTYDPRDTGRYLDFFKAYQYWSPKGASTSKDTEVMEAGVTGAVFACTAFRAAGETERAKFAERILKSNIDYMLDHMQNPDGSTRWDVNVYLEQHPGAYRDTVTDPRVPDTNQIGEWLRSIARAMIYFMDVPGEQDYVAKLYKAGLKSADYLVRVGTDQIGQHKHVIRHFKLVDGVYPGKRELWHQEGRQCDVYLPRAMAGLSYFAYARELLAMRGSPDPAYTPVPQSWLDAMHDTTAWCLEKMDPETGWFDMQCGYEVEGGCHAFLGNMYLAEATQGYYLFAALRKDAAESKLAADCTRRALYFVTDHDRFTSRFNGPFEFWVGPYLYWQFSEYLGSIGPDPKFSAFLTKLHDSWAVKRGWQDFFQRTGDSIVYRSNELSNIHQSILAYPALRLMEEQGKPFTYPVPRLSELSP